ncbi:MAG: response regulator transcription factor [Clostridia bacterium]|nr:response regulator transcription factor [Clostridia bacterium]
MQSNKYKLLAIEDEPEIRALLQTLLEAAGYKILSAENGETGKMLQASHQPDLVLLDLGLPDIDGREVLRAIRKDSACPVIVLSAISDEDVIVQALDLGANDYIRKPFGAAELLARVRNTLRTAQGVIAASDGKFASDGLVIDYDARTVELDGTQIHFTQTEYNILALLAKHSGKMLSYSFICKEIWGYTDAGSTKKLQVNMANIRKKFAAIPNGLRHITNELGVGYRMQNKDI